MPPARSASARSPSARSASAAPRRQSRSANRHPPPRPRQVTLRAPALRIRWERVGRYGLLFVFVIVVGLYAEHTLSYFSTRAQANRQQAIVTQLSRQNAALTQQAKSLRDPETIVREARSLGMVRPGERSYAITGRPQR